MKEEQNIVTATFGNGLRAVAARADGNVTYSGVLVNAGSRDEDATRQGLAHFVEHTIFKGTRRRKSWHISNRMESVGGELNAYTTKEETMIYTNAPAGYADRGLDLLSDLIMNASFPEAEIEREKEVIVEEIKSYLDSPSESVYDEFEELAYRGSALAHNILGTPESVRNLTGQDGRHFIDTRYTPERMVAYCVDTCDPEKSIARLERYFGKMSPGPTSHERKPFESAPHFCETRDHGNHQANTIMGCRVFSRQDQRRFALFLLNNYLGGPCMNSRLNQELRERRGLVYTVDSNVALLSDTGLLLIYFGTSPDAVDKCERLIRRELERIADKCLPEKKFAAIREQYCGQMIVGSDLRENQAMAKAKSLMYFNEIIDISHTADRIRSLTPEDLRMSAELILTHGLSRLTLR